MQWKNRNKKVPKTYNKALALFRFIRNFYYHEILIIIMLG